YDEITSYNNFYEYGTGKEDPARLAPRYLKPEPWTVEVSGEAEVTGRFAVEDFIGAHDLQERIYRLRCVEAWSMVVPWVGISLADVIKRYRPTSRAKYVKFTTLLDPEQMPEQRDAGSAFSFLSTIDWPYVEGLRIDEATNPLAILAVGLYGKELPAQNGAPIRLVVPWKYGFKSIKSIVAIHFQEEQPETTWHKVAPNEYGFYANVNPKVDHPRWSQARERRIGDLFKRDTLMFNGYGDEVASLYKGMDLRKHY
ncbi:MAG: protein-methionine-sulfoxide reductase catalytic subunit MsrP, partial [Ectothiorhodospiraceae bacterium]